MTSRTYYRSAGLIVLLVAGCSSSTPLDPIISGLVAKDVLDDAEQAANTLLYNAEASVHNEVNHAANEMLVVVAEARRGIGESAEKVCKSLSNDRKAIVQQVYEFAQELEKLEDLSVTIEDNVALDLDLLVDRVPFLKDRKTIRRLDGIQQLKSERPYYAIEITGSGIGIPQSDRAATIRTLSISETNVISSCKIEPIDIHRVRIKIPNAVLDQHFETDQLAVVKCGIDVGWKNPETGKLLENIKFPFAVYLYAKIAGVVDVNGERETFGWKSAGFFTQTGSSPNNHCSGDCDDADSYPTKNKNHPFSKTWSIPDFNRSPPYQEGNMRLVKAGSFIKQTTNAPVSAAISISKDGSSMTMSGTTNTVSATFQVNGATERFSRMEVESVASSVPAEFGSVMKIRLPVGTKASLLKFKTSWGDTQQHTLIQSGNIGKYLRVTGFSQVGDEDVYTIEVFPPTHLN